MFAIPRVKLLFTVLGPMTGGGGFASPQTLARLRQNGLWGGNPGAQQVAPPFSTAIPPGGATGIMQGQGPGSTPRPPLFPNGPISQTSQPGTMGPNGSLVIPPGPNQSGFPGQGPLANYTGNSLTVGPATVGTTPQNIIDSPAYQFRMNQGNQAVQQGAAAKGSLLTGGTLKDMQDYSQGLASTEFGNQWDRDYRLSALNSGISEGNAGRTLTGLSSLINTGFDAARGQGGYDDQAGNYQAGGTVDSTSAMNTGMGQVANTIGAYLAQRKLRQQQGGVPGQNGTGPVMYGDAIAPPMGVRNA